MNPLLVLRILGQLLALFSLTMLPPAAISLIYADGAWPHFLGALAIILAVGLALYLPLKHHRAELRIRDGFLVVTLFWFGLGIASATPLLLVDIPIMSVTDAVFEAVSGLTTTGATVLVGLDTLPHSVLWYRQQLQWLGGAGIIVLAVAILPMLGVGGMQLYRAETPGPMKDTKLTPRIKETAKALWLVYVTLTVLCAISYYFAGMNWFDAIGHSFTTLATGGFSTHDASLAYFNSPLIEWLAVLFMFLGGVNFSLHFIAWRRITPDLHFDFSGRMLRLRWPRRRRVEPLEAIVGYFQDPEFRAFAGLQAFLIFGIAAFLMFAGTYQDFGSAVTKAALQAMSFGTNTGYATADFAAWPGALPVLLILASIVGGCAGSTAGGMKVLRWLLIFKQGLREMARLLHPSAEIPVRLGERGVSTQIAEGVWGFFAIYVVVYAFLMSLLMFTGLDQVTAFSAVAATVNNLGPGLGEVSSTFGTVPDAAKWIGVIAMVMGRLEIFTLLILLTPEFWRR